MGLIPLMEETFMQAHLLSFEKLATKCQIRAFHGTQSVVSFVAEKSLIPMHSLTHALNIGTLATWMSVAAFGSAGVILGRAVHMPPPAAEVAGVELVQEMQIESFDLVGSTEVGANEATMRESMNLPSPPETLPPLNYDALPEVPEMPSVDAKKVSAAIKPAFKATPRPQKSSAVLGNSSTANKESASGSATISNAERLASGRMPAPHYPSEARKQGQAGTVLIEFTVDASGRVSSAHIASPCPWSVLNQEALRAVKNWKFPPGGVMTYKKPIVFKLRNS